MDAHALLTSQGWRGSGHSLHPTSDQNGLSRPLLVSRKQNNLGVGRKQHRTSDMWWMNAFDKSLKCLDTAEEGKVVQTLTSGGLDMVAKGGSKFVGSGGLYACFVRGDSLRGTITPEGADERPATTKRRRVEVGDDQKTKEQCRVRREAKRAARARNALAGEPIAATLTDKPAKISKEKKETSEEEMETEEQRRERRKQKKLLRQAREESMDSPIATTKRKKRRKDAR